MRRSAGFLSCTAFLFLINVTIAPLCKYSVFEQEVAFNRGFIKVSKEHQVLL